jgi:DNA-binding transcriptional LysR family regulator
MSQWDDFRFFLALKRNKTLKASAKELKVDQATVGRRIQALEEDLRTQLFEKSSDGYFLTVAGERILPMLVSTEENILSVQRIISGREERIEGKVKIAMPGALANHWFIPRIKAFIIKYPNIHFELLTGSEVLNLSRREADLAIRLVKPTQKDLIVKKNGEIELALYSHQSILNRYERKIELKDLKSIPFIGLYPNSTSALEKQLLKKIEANVHITLQSSAWSSVFYSIQEGLGIGILPTFLANRDPKLIQVQIVEPLRAPLWLVVHPDVIKSARIRAVTEFIGKL